MDSRKILNRYTHDFLFYDFVGMIMYSLLLFVNFNEAKITIIESIFLAKVCSLYHIIK